VTTIRVHIERLVLDGLPVERGHAEALRQAVAAELGRQLAARGLGAGFMQGGMVPRVAAPGLSVSPGEAPAALGARIAGAAAEGLTR
jgi:hypothetical protein